MWRFTVKAPDGRVLFSDIGGRDVEGRAKGVADRFNALLPWHAKPEHRARVVTTPASHPTP